MNRRTARVIHQTTNLSYWLENPNWSTGKPISDFGCRIIRLLPFSLHEIQKQIFYDPDKVLAVSGETVVTKSGAGKVDKFMFRYPGKVSLEAFESQVRHEVGIVTTCLAGVALPTEIAIKPAAVFRNHNTIVPAVTQTQERLDLSLNPALDLETVSYEPSSPARDKTAKDLERLLEGTDTLITDFDYYPDIANSSGNLRRNILDGSIALIDVMPYYTTGKRLIGDNPPNAVPHITSDIQDYQEFVGQYGG